MSVSRAPTRPLKRALATLGRAASATGRPSPRLAGGLALARDKPGLEHPIVEVPLPPTLALPLLDTMRRPLEPIVAVGQPVACGEPLARARDDDEDARLRPVPLASAAGRVVAIVPRPVAHPSGAAVPCVLIATDAPGTASAAAVDAPATTLTAGDALDLERLAACGVVGLGGAGFATALKVADARANGARTLLVNAAECEPGIACDEALMRVAADEIVAGARALAALARCDDIIVAIESDKREACVALRHAIERARGRGTRGGAGATVREVGSAAPNAAPGASMASAPIPRLLEIAPLYPSGAERLLIALATGVRVPPGQAASAAGVLSVNVATARAAHRARLGEPLFARVVTIGGTRAAAPCNARVVFGTPLGHLLAATAQGARAADTRLRVGGPLSGFDVADEAVPVTATVNRVALEPPPPETIERPCIRCAACSEVCPAGLLPQELLRHARAGDAIRGERAGLDACIECGCCDVVCPSAIPLTTTFRHARAMLAAQRRGADEAARLEARYRRRERRLAERERARKRVRAERQAALEAARRARGEAAASVSRRGADGDPPDEILPDKVPPVASPAGDDPIAAALARARARRRRDGGGRAG